MGVHSFEDLIKHVGHKIECDEYGGPNDGWNVTLECVDCHEVLVSFDNRGELEEDE